MVENSLILRSFTWLFQFIWAIYQGSIIKKVVDNLFNFFSEVFKHSILYPVFIFNKLEASAYPVSLNKLGRGYGWIIGGLNSVYVRAARNSRLMSLLSNKRIGLWFENSWIVQMTNRFIGGASFEGLLICAFAFLVPFVGKQLSLVLAFAIFGLFLISAVIKGNKKFLITKTAILAVCYYLVLSINSFMSINPSGSMRDFAIHTGGFFVMFAIINSPLRKNDYRLILDGLLIAGTLVSFYAIYQYVAGVPMGSGWVDSSQNPGLTIRVFGTFENPNIFAEFLIMVLPLSIARGIECLSNKKWFTGIIFGFPAAVMAVALLMTASRAGWLGFALSLIIFILLINMKFIIPMILAGVGMIPLLPASILQRLSTIGSLSDSSNLYRYNLWKSSFEIIQDFFVTGIGTGYLAFRAITPYYMKNMAPFHSHNTYIQTLVEFGIVGFVIFMVWCYLLFKDGMDTAQKSNDFGVRLYSAALTAGFCGLLLHGIAEHILYYSKIMLLFWVIVGLIIKAKYIEDSESK